MLLLAAVFCGAPVYAVDLDHVTGAVVKLFVTFQSWDIKQPWSKESANRRTCSGFVIEQGILTNAHCIMDDAFIQAEVPNLPDKIEVERVAVNHQTDLALVRPRPPAMIPHDIEPIRFGDLPEQREKVVTIGYSIGGRQVSFTEGVVSRIDVMSYAHSNLPNLLVQTDAAITGGNSGGPVFSDRTGECLGVATQRYSGSIGYFIPVPVISQFLTDLEDGRVDGVPYIGMQLQLLENPTLRGYLGMKPGQSGARIAKLAETSSGIALEEGDVLMAIEGTQIYNDGRIQFRKYGRIGLGYEISTRQIGDIVNFDVLRGGHERTISVELSGDEIHIIPLMPLYDMQPPYFVIGGLLFRVVERGYLGKDVPFDLRRYYGTLRGKEGDIDELVIISEIYESDLNKGYDRNVYENVRVVTVNGSEIRSLQDVVDAINENQGEYHVIELDNQRLVVLDRTRVEAEDKLIRRRYGIQ